MMQSNPVNTETKGAIKKVSILTGVLIKQVEFLKKINVRAFFLQGLAKLSVIIIEDSVLSGCP